MRRRPSCARGACKQNAVLSWACWIAHACLKQRNSRTFNGLCAGSGDHLAAAQVQAGAWALRSWLYVSTEAQASKLRPLARSLYLCGRSSGAVSRATPIAVLVARWFIS